MWKIFRSKPPLPIHPGPPTVVYETTVDPLVSAIDVSFGDRLALVFEIHWDENARIAVRTIEESRVDLAAFRAAFDRYSREAEEWVRNSRAVEAEGS